MTAIQNLRFVPGFRLIDGSDLNIMVDVLNGVSAGTFIGTFDGIVGGTTPAAGHFTTIGASGLATLASITASAAVTLSPASANVVLSPTGTGVVTINPATAGAMDNVVIGANTAKAATFTTVAGTAFTGTYFTASAYFDESTSDALTAAGTTRSDALALTTAINNVTTAASSTGVILPASATVGIGGRVVIYNNGANALKVYGAGSDTIDGTAGSSGVTLTNALRCEYRVTSAGKFLSAKLGAVSS